MSKFSPLKTAATNYRVLSAATTNGALIKATPALLQGVTIHNTGTIAFVKLYNKATAPTVGTDTPLMTIPVAATTGSVVISFPAGIVFETGLGIAITGAIGDSDTTSVGANQVTVNLQYN